MLFVAGTGLSQVRRILAGYSPFYSRCSQVPVAITSRTRFWPFAVASIAALMALLEHALVLVIGRCQDQDRGVEDGLQRDRALTHPWGSERLFNLLHRPGLTSTDEVLDLSFWPAANQGQDP